MLTIVDITEDNCEEYNGIIPVQYLSDMGREYLRGLAGIREDTHETAAAIIWEVHNVDQEQVDNKAEILWFWTQNEEDALILLKSFDSRIAENNVRSSYFELEGLSEEEISAFKKAGFSTGVTEGTDVFITVEEMGKLDIAKKKAESYVVSLSTLSSFQFRAGIMNSIYHGRYGLLEDLPFLPMSRYDGEISCCVLTDGKVTGLLLVHLLESSLYRVELLFSEQLDGAVNVLNMLRFALHAAQRKCDMTDVFLIRRHNRNIKELCKKLFPQKKGKEVIRGTRK